MSQTTGSGHAALRRGRWSAPGSDYFLTICTKDRQRGLSDAKLTTSIFDLAHRLSIDGQWQVRTGTVMPDHLHLLITLGNRMNLSDAIRLFKGRLTPALRAAGLRWQHACFEHRVRIDEDRLPLFLYIFLNPYRDKLIDAGVHWPGYYCCADDWAWFEPLTSTGSPFPEWLQ